MVEPTAELAGLAQRVIGAAIEVRRLLDPGFVESIYEEALCVELGLRDIACARQVPVSMRYKREQVGEARIDLLVRDSLVVELKTVGSIAPIHLAQVLPYLSGWRKQSVGVRRVDTDVRHSEHTPIVGASWHLG